VKTLQLITLAFVFVSAQPAPSQQSGVIARCGPSKGQGYFFEDKLFNPTGPSWIEDGISDGKIVLINLNEEWDILFDDVIGARGYREDGAVVVLLGNQGGKLTIGAFHANYTDIYTFDVMENVVLWSSHKIGTPIKKVAIYQAECS
jgi:hypothetical protein